MVNNPFLLLWGEPRNVGTLTVLNSVLRKCQTNLAWFYQTQWRLSFALIQSFSSSTIIKTWSTKMKCTNYSNNFTIGTLQVHCKWRILSNKRLSSAPALFACRHSFTQLRSQSTRCNAFSYQYTSKQLWRLLLLQ